MTDYVRRERGQFDELNARWIAEERRRAERIHRYNNRRIEDSMTALLGRIGSLERENDLERVRIVPALRGQIEGAAS